KIVTKNEDARRATRFIEGPDCLDDAWGWIARAETYPAAQRLQDYCPSLRRIRNPLIGISGKHVVTLVIQNLHTPDFRVCIQDFPHLAYNKTPSALLHTARCVDYEDYVLAVDWNSAIRSVLCNRLSVRLVHKPAHFFAQGLLNRLKPLLDLHSHLRCCLGGSELVVCLLKFSA